MILLILILAFGSAVLVYISFIGIIQENRNKEEQVKRKRLTSFFYNIVKIIGVYNSKLKIDNMRTKSRIKLITAGNPGELSPDEFLAIREMSAVGFILIGSMLFGSGLFTMLIWGVFGFYYPVLWLNGKIKQRQLSILKSLPSMLDLLTLSVEAGLDFTAAIQRIVTKSRMDALHEELARMLQMIKMGKTRKDALISMSDRVRIPDLTAVISALVQADEMGTSLGHILKIQAEQMRTSRSQRAEKLAMEAPIKIIFPLLLFIFPAVFIVIFAPVIIQIITTGF